MACSLAPTLPCVQTGGPSICPTICAVHIARARSNSLTGISPVGREALLPNPHPYSSQQLQRLDPLNVSFLYSSVFLPRSCLCTLQHHVARLKYISSETPGPGNCVSCSPQVVGNQADIRTGRPPTCRKRFRIVSGAAILDKRAACHADESTNCQTAAYLRSRRRMRRMVGRSSIRCLR